VAPKRREVYVSAGWRFVVVGLMITIGWLSPATVGLGPLVGSAQAHLQLSDGTWTWRYYTRSQASGQDTHCENNTGKVDPTNIIVYQYGEWSRINGHLNGETHWSYWNPVPATTQVICTTTDGANFNQQVQKDDQKGHVEFDDQAHFRIFSAGHSHSANSAKWSVLDVHHEDFNLQTHVINEDWETWENHIVGIAEIGGSHNIYHDYYYRVPAGDFRGFFDNGLVTRVGGLHDGNY
jgi:hypothetical protein